jgi:hypothetical protein
MFSSWEYEGLSSLLSYESFAFLCMSDPSAPHTGGTTCLRHNLPHKTNRAQCQDDEGRLREPVVMHPESRGEIINLKMATTLFAEFYSQKPKLYIESNQAIKIEHK